MMVGEHRSTLYLTIVHAPLHVLLLNSCASVGGLRLKGKLEYNHILIVLLCIRQMHCCSSYDASFTTKVTSNEFSCDPFIKSAAK